MGYYMHVEESSFEIKKENVGAALAAIKAIPDKKGGFPEFSWVNRTFRAATSLQEAMSEWRWPIALDKDGNVTEIEFSGEKFGDDELLFVAIAPHVTSESYIMMRGEDDHGWQWLFRDGKLYECEALRTFGPPKEVTR